MGTAPLSTRILKQTALVVASLLVTAIVLELGLRAFWGGYYQKFEPDRPFGKFEFHPTRALSLIPSWEYLDHDREFENRLRHNSMGLRGPESALEKTPGRTRVLVVGDSMTYGIGVEYEETYSAVLEALDPRLQVINAGAPGYSGGQQLLLMQEKIGELAPDVVILAYFWNDVWEAYRSQYPRFELRDGQLQLEPPRPASPQHPAFDRLWRRHERRERRYGSIESNSYLYRFVSDRFKLLEYAWRDFGGESTEVNSEGLMEDEEEAAAWELSYALLRAQRDLAHRHGAKFVVLVIPDQVQVEKDVTVYGVPPVLWRIQERVVEFAEREGIPVIDPLETLRAIRERKGEPQYHRLDRHWNRVGHRHMGEILLPELRRLGVVPPPTG